MEEQADSPQRSSSFSFLLPTPLGDYNTIDSSSGKRKRLNAPAARESSSSVPISAPSSTPSQSLTLRIPPLSVFREAKKKVARAEEANRSLVQANNFLAGTNSALALANARTHEEGQFNLNRALNEGLRVQAQLRAEHNLALAQGDEWFRNLTRDNDAMRERLEESQKRNEELLSVSVSQSRP